MIVWIDGRLTPLAEARVSPLDHGITVGDGVFETMRVYGGVPFAWRRHLDRLAASASGLGLQSPDRAGLRVATDAVLDANGLGAGDARVRITVTGGPTSPGSSRHGSSRTTVFVTATPFEPAAPTADVVIAPWTRNEHGALAGLKTISYGANVRALAYAEAHDAIEAVFANTKMDLCEATGSNVFVVHDDMLCTPPASA
ncbi:MAG TPA: aminotransferase class IV, partial [Acidimicrobiia bacterium]|nr:aminotransferase class IV [Acidimicrobiia bacterium]